MHDSLQLKSFHLHKESFFSKGTNNNGNEQGYPVFYFDPIQHQDDVCVLRQVDTYTRNRYILAVAILLTQFLIPVVIPFYARIFYDHIHSRITKGKSTTAHYFFGFIFTTALLGVFGFCSNVYLISTEEHNDVSRSSISDVRLYYILGSIIMLVINPLLAFINIWYNNSRRHGRCCFCCSSWNDFFSVISVTILVMTANVLSFNIMYVFMGLISAPIETGSLLFLYLTVFFLLTMFVALLHKGFSIANKKFKHPKSDIVFAPLNVPCRDPEFRIQLEQSDEGFTIMRLVDSESDTSGQQFVDYQPPPVPQSGPRAGKINACLVAFDALIAVVSAILVLVNIFLYMAFYYEMAITVEPYTSSAGFLSSFGSLVPAMFTLTAGILEKRLITFLSGFDTADSHTGGTTNGRSNRRRDTT